MLLYRVAGADAEDFLHRVTSGTVKGLAAGQGAGGLLLNGQSRMIAQFDLLRLDPTSFLLAVPEACAEGLAAGLGALHFAEDLEMGFLDLRATFHPISRLGERAALFPFEGAIPALVWASPVPGYACMTTSHRTEIDDEFHFARIAALVPWPPTDWDSNTPALETGLLASIDRNKGCYPGQEVVERSLNVGHPARVLMSLEGEGPAPAKVKFASGAEGTVLSAMSFEERTHLLVRAPFAQKGNAPEGYRLLKSWI